MGIAEREVDGLEALVLTAPHAAVEASFVPGAGMVGCSLRHRGDELLGQRGGLSRYVAERSTMGIPLLYPWANRLGARRFEVAGRTVDVDAAQPPPKADPNGLPIHGLLGAAPGWQVGDRTALADGGRIVARFDFAAHAELVRAFPFPHELEVDATLTGARLEIATTVKPTGDVSVPIAFGYHPYLRLPNVERSGWNLTIPVIERLPLDDGMLPTGEREPVEPFEGRLGSRTFDDAYVAPASAQPFVVAAANRRIEVQFDSGYPYAQVYAPPDDDVIAVEPMTAPTNALVAGGSVLPAAAPGESFRAAFSVTVVESAG